MASGGAIVFLLLALPLLAAGCAPRPSNHSASAPAPVLNADRSAGAFAQTDPWRLTTNNPNAARGNHGIFLGNGYLGATFGANGGPAGDERGNSTGYVAGVYTTNQDTFDNITPLPSEDLARLGFTEHLRLPPPPGRRGDKTSRYSQTLDMKRGLLTTSIGDATTTTFVSRADPHLIVQRTVAWGSSLSFIDFGFISARSQGGVEVASHAVGVSRDGVDVRYVAVYTSREAADPKKAATKAAEAAAQAGYETLLARHQAAWAKLWRADITIEGDGEAQQLVHKLMFDLLQSTRPGLSDSIPPETLSGDFYKGHIFWDADVWMFPALLAQHPDLARTILDYRFKHLNEARRRARAQGLAGADFPWESAVSGREVAPSGFATGRHVTAGVGWAHWQYWLATQDKAWLRNRGWPVLSSVADHWASRATKNAKTGRFDIKAVFGPDELKGRVDNNTYTNALARHCLLAAAQAAKIVGKPANPRWATVAAKIALPFDRTNNRYLARENDDGIGTKQADGELVLYPADLAMDAQTRANTFDFHAARPIRHGPAMTASIHALIAARLGRASQAERFFRDAYKPFVRGPFVLFSEKRSLDRCVFATGAGGILQSVLFGFGGLDYNDFDAARPSVLPSSWKKLTITGIRRAGKTYTLTVTPQKRTLTRQP